MQLRAYIVPGTAKRGSADKKTARKMFQNAIALTEEWSALAIGADMMTPLREQASSDMAVESRCDAWFRCGLSVADPFVCRCLTSPSCSVFTPRSSNRTGAFRASGSRRKAHEVAHGKLRVRWVSRTNPSTSCSTASGNCFVAGQLTLCLAHNHWRSLFRACCSTAR